jgi:hypothetical protein
MAAAAAATAATAATAAKATATGAAASAGAAGAAALGAAGTVGSTVAATVGAMSPTTAHFAGGIMFLFLFICIIVIVVFKTNLKTSNDDYMIALYPDMGRVQSINDFDETYSYLVRDYYIKTAFNCCSSGDYSGDYVSTTALKQVIRQGARCLDFEIYSLSGVPVISSSSQSEYTMKETYNYVTLSEAFDIISSDAFSGQPKVPNPSDPLFLCFRIKSNNILVFNEISRLIQTKLASRLLDSRYGYCFHGDNLGKIKLSSFMNKIIIIVDETPGTESVPNEVYRKTSLYEYANIAIRGPTSKKTFAQVQAPTPSLEAMVENNKKNLMYVVPERSSKPENVYAPTAAIASGCQFIGMSFQSDDAPIKAYNKMFDEVGSAFKLKPPELRYIPLTLDAPTPSDPSRSLTSDMTAKTPFGQQSA